MIITSWRTVGQPRSAMADASKHPSSASSIISYLQTLFSPLRDKRTKIFAYGFLFAFVAGTIFLAFNPNSTSSPIYHGFFSVTSTATASARSQFSSIFSYIIQGNLRSAEHPSHVDANFDSFTDPNRIPLAHQSDAEKNLTQVENDSVIEAGTVIFSPPTGRRGNASHLGKINDSTVHSASENQLRKKIAENSSNVEVRQSENIPVLSQPNNSSSAIQKNEVISVTVSSANETRTSSDTAVNMTSENGGNESVGIRTEGVKLGSDVQLRKPVNSTKAREINRTITIARETEFSLSPLKRCNIFDGRWVKDDSYPLYKEGSCPHIDEPFDCALNGRPDRDYQKLRWQPKDCNIPRLNATNMLERLRGRRLVFVGDSLNRNMWESLVCILRNSVADTRNVFEMSGRREFRTEGSYSFFFKAYNCTVEFFRSPFLVQEWEMPESNGSKKETLRLDLIERKSDRYKRADILVFNTGHWWTHEKTSRGKDYYQEGSHVYDQLNVVEAFRKALLTWARWVDANVNPRKTLVFFRGYSVSHFCGGGWNSGGVCDREMEPIYNERYLSKYPLKMNVLESVLRGMKTHISFLNITRMTDYRKDAHPSIYRKRHLTDEERRSPEMYQDCSHWCLPGVPDSWNELLYAQLLVHLHQKEDSE